MTFVTLLHTLTLITAVHNHHFLCDRLLVANVHFACMVFLVVSIIHFHKLILATLVHCLCVAGDQLCAASTCTADDVASCCDARAACNSDTALCPAATHVFSIDAEQLKCVESSCTEADMGTCCEKRALCNSSASLCPAATHIAKSPNEEGVPHYA